MTHSDPGACPSMREGEQKAAWDSACRAWSRDDGKNPEKTGALGERLMYAATDLICAQDDELDALRAKGAALVNALARFGYPVSGGARVTLGDYGSSEAMAVDSCAREFIAALGAQK